MGSSEKPTSDVARQLGVRRNQLYKWKERVDKPKAKAFLGAGRQKGKADELTRLRQELETVKKERDILKKAAAYFTKELGEVRFYSSPSRSV
jgi:transposase